MGRITYEAWDFIQDLLANENVPQQIKTRIFTELSGPTPREVALRQAILDVLNSGLPLLQRLAAVKVVIDAYKETLV